MAQLSQSAGEEHPTKSAAPITNWSREQLRPSGGPALRTGMQLTARLPCRCAMRWLPKTRATCVPCLGAQSIRAILAR